MRAIKREEIDRQSLPGRVIQSAVGKNNVLDSDKMAIGFAYYSDESGPMEPHHHAEEFIYVISSDRGWVRFGPAPDQLSDPVALQAGMILHFPAWEWHVFQFAPGGHVDIVFIYGQVTQLRPEQQT